MILVQQAYNLRCVLGDIITSQAFLSDIGRIMKIQISTIIAPYIVACITIATYMRIKIPQDPFVKIFV